MRSGWGGACHDLTRAIYSIESTRLQGKSEPRTQKNGVQCWQLRVGFPASEVADPLYVDWIRGGASFPSARRLRRRPVHFVVSLHEELRTWNSLACRTRSGRDWGNPVRHSPQCQFHVSSTTLRG